MNDLSVKDIPVSIEDIMHTAYLQYSLSVNVGRAIPDVRDGMKPGNRRILFAMRQLGLSKSHSFAKSARVVGEVIGKYHPHGDASVYDTLVRMAQDFSMRNPLVDGQGNFGSIDGDPPAAYRYTECRMERITEELLADIEKDTVNMLPTFDEQEKEPEVLPSGFPNLLVNGSTGIGVGMATNIPPHNLSEVIDATVCLLDNPAASVLELMQHLPGPDFPTGATICGRTELRKFYETGRGNVKIRAKAEIIEKDGREQIIVTEIPYAVNKEMLVKRIAELVNDKVLNGISGLWDETSKRTGIRIVIDIKRGSMGSIVLNQLYAHTQLEDSFSCIMLVVDHNRPRVLNLQQTLQAYIDHRLEVITRRTQFELNKAMARAHILEGLIIASENIDEVVKIIRASKNREEAAPALKARFKLSDLQVQAILEMRLHQLTSLSVEDIKNEYNELLKLIAYLQDLLASREKRIGVIKTEILQVKEKYCKNDARRTVITTDASDIDIADLIPRHSCIITVSNTGYIKRVPADTFKTQHRGGVGIMGMETKDEDFVEHLFNADSHDLIFFITDKGFMHWLYVYEIPEGSRTSKGKAIVNMIKVEPGEKIRAMLTLSPEELERDDRYIVMATKNGVIKKTALNEFKNLRKVGIRALSFKENDDLIGADLTNGSNEIILSTAHGLACRFDESDIRAMGRGAMGVTGIRFKIENDFVVSMEVVEAQKEAETDEEAEQLGGPQILVISDGGMGKRSYVSTYRKTKRGAKGVTSIKLKENELVLAAIKIEKGDEVLITTENGQTVRIPSDEIKTVGRASKGVIIMTPREGDKLAGATKIVKIDGEDEAAPADATDPSAPVNPSAPADTASGSANQSANQAEPPAPEQE